MIKTEPKIYKNKIICTQSILILGNINSAVLKSYLKKKEATYKNEVCFILFGRIFSLERRGEHLSENICCSFTIETRAVYTVVLSC